MTHLLLFNSALDMEWIVNMCKNQKHAYFDVYS